MTLVYVTTQTDINGPFEHVVSEKTNQTYVIYALRDNDKKVVELRQTDVYGNVIREATNVPITTSRIPTILPKEYLRDKVQWNISVPLTTKPPPIVKDLVKIPKYGPERPETKWLTFGSFQVSSNCLGDYVLKDVVGKGGFGEVFQVCQDKAGCNYVVKLIEPITDAKQAENEVQITTDMGEALIGPVVYKAGTCLMKYENKDFEGTFIVMEKWQMNLKEYVKKYPIIFKQYEPAIKKAYITLVRSMVRIYKIAHHDLSAKNLMLNVDKQGIPQKFCIIDYGLASKAEEDDMEIERDNLNTIFEEAKEYAASLIPKPEKGETKEEKKWKTFRSFQVSSNCLSDYELKGEIIGKGAYGEVFQVCQKEGCDYVIKLIRPHTEGQPDRTAEELKISILMGDAGIGPKVYKSGFCDMIWNGGANDDEEEDQKNNEPVKFRGAFIVMEKWQTSLIRYARKNPERYEKYEKKIYAGYKKLIEKMAKKYNVLQADIHGSNLMLNVNEKGEPIAFCIIDWGRAEIRKSLSPEHDLQDLKDTFDEVKKDIDKD